MAAMADGVAMMYHEEESPVSVNREIYYAVCVASLFCLASSSGHSYVDHTLFWQDSLASSSGHNCVGHNYLLAGLVGIVQRVVGIAVADELASQMGWLDTDGSAQCQVLRRRSPHARGVSLSRLNSYGLHSYGMREVCH